MTTSNMQEFSRRILKAHIEKNRLASSYLITGTDPARKIHLALWFAQALNCEQQPPQPRRLATYEVATVNDCKCSSCGKISRKTHPDIHWVGEDPKARSLKIEEARGTLAQAALMPYEGKCKVFIFIGAERLTAEAANALLKTLEEPPPRTVFLLLVENRFHLLTTIVSRCFEVRVGAGPAVISDEPRHSSRVRDNRWEDYFEALQSKPRHEVQAVLTQLMEECAARTSLDAADALWQAKEALEDNVNQKLALSRLAMKLRQGL